MTILRNTAARSAGLTATLLLLLLLPLVHACSTGVGGVQGGTTQLVTPKAGPVGAAHSLDPGVMSALSAELERVLAQQAAQGKARNTSTPPSGAASATKLAYSTPTSALNWGYYSVGDYDQNGVVSVGDLTPLGMHFGEVSPFGAGIPFPTDSLGAVIDGNGDGVLNIGDVTPIGINFRTRVEGYRVYASPTEDAAPATPDSPNGPGTVWLDSVPLDTLEVPSSRRSLSVQVVPTGTEQYFWVRPYDGNEDGAASNAVGVIEPPNQAPVALLLPEGATATLAHIVWNASNSFDPDGTLARYEWDFDGDGEFEFDSDGQVSLDSYYYAAGLYTVSLRVTDNEGAQDTAQASVTITQQADWHINTAVETIEFTSSGAVLDYTHLELIDAGGHPALMYERVDDDAVEQVRTLDFIRATDPQGESWGEAQVLHSFPDSTTINRTDIALDARGRPIVALYQSEIVPGPEVDTRYDTLFTRAIDVAGSSWIAPELLHTYSVLDGGVTEGAPFTAARVLIVDGRPAIAGPYGQSNPGDSGSLLGFLVASDPDGSDWSGAEPSGFAGGWSSGPSNIRSVGPNPAFIGVSGEDVLFYRGLDADFQDWSNVELVDEHEKAEEAELLDLGGLPAVVYYDSASDDLRFRRALNAEAAQWTEPVVLDPRAEDNSGRPFIIEGRPGVIYQDRITDDWMMTVANDSLGQRWSIPAAVTLDMSEYEFANGLKAAAVAGLPMTAIYDREVIVPPNLEQAHRFVLLGYY